MFYFLLAEYIYFTKNRDILLDIFYFIDQASDSINVVLKIDEKKGEVTMVDIANILILFQNLLIRHLKLLNMEIVQKIAAKALFFK
jgi:hypothetical protein